MTDKIMHDNTLYLKEWMRYNPSIANEIILDGQDICCTINGNLERQNISQIYLPDMLYNEQLRANIPLEEEISGTNLFHIIKLYCQTAEILEQEKKELQSSPSIVDLRILKDQNNQEFIVLIDNNQRKYRFNTNQPEAVINLYNELKEKKEIVTLKEFGSVIKNGLYENGI